MNQRIPLLLAIGTLLVAPALIVIAAPDSQDPGPRGGPAGAGDPLPGLTAGQLSAFTDGADDFNTSHSVDGSIRDADATGLGPSFNLENCGGCHATPGNGGSSPERNPQFESAMSPVEQTSSRHFSLALARSAKPDSSPIPTAAPTAAPTRCLRSRDAAMRRAAPSNNPTSKPNIGAATSSSVFRRRRSAMA